MSIFISSDTKPNRNISGGDVQNEQPIQGLSNSMQDVVQSVPVPHIRTEDRDILKKVFLEKEHTHNLVHNINF